MDGEKIKQTRESLKMSQEELSEKSGVSRATISKIENGLTEVVKLETLSKLANALKKDIKYFF
ncbi:helix-turn-helix domain-containing protein [Aerococcaceae bacterium NML210727]|nr:helix-turn-helix domain-containing protein [Aerococcaceae bacterium NML210727]MCW6655054.1 helix-turn-helix domain-containing protein [Aerococcaceae bacterium NML201296]MCW6680842.1 helix-turn-helix domain-containing protein [Aerococcaceae bacterium NML130460]